MSRSTRIKVWDRHCPWALHLHDQGVPRGGSARFAVGIAAHAMLQAMADKQPQLEDTGGVISEVAFTLLSTPRFFDGVPDPPMQPHDVQEAILLAEQYVDRFGVPPPGKAELGLGMDMQGRTAPYATAYFKAAIDLVYETWGGDEDNPLRIVVTRDYKSAWHTNESELETLQIWGQAVLAHLNYPDAQAIRREVVNLRTGGIFQDTVWLDDNGLARLAAWRSEILLCCAALELSMADPKPIPGAGCMQCPWAYACSSCLAQAVDPPPDLPPEMDPLASSFAAAQARRDALVGFIKEAAQHGNLKIPGGHVGFVGQHRAEVPPFQAAEAVVDAWKDTQLCAWDDSVQSSVVSLLAALKLGKGNIDSLAKSMYGPRGLSACDDWAAKRQALLSACTIDTVVPELKVVTDGMMSAYRGGASSPEQDSAPA